MYNVQGILQTYNMLTLPLTTEPLVKFKLALYFNVAYKKATKFFQSDPRFPIIAIC